MMEYNEKLAIVTGGSTGIGRAIAIYLAENGANVVINYSSNDEAAREVQQVIIDNGGRAVLKKCDVSSFEETKTMIQDIKKEWGRIDILVNNAGITKDNLLMRMKEEEFDNVLEVNLKGTFNCIKHVSRIMMKQRYGRIINVSSVVGLMGNMGQCNYAASKAGILGLTKAAARELAPRGVTVNAVAPGLIDTKMTEKLSDEMKDMMLTNIPLKKLGTPENVAHAVGFLASDKAAYITGQVISIDGGLYM